MNGLTTVVLVWWRWWRLRVVLHEEVEALALVLHHGTQDVEGVKGECDEVMVAVVVVVVVEEEEGQEEGGEEEEEEEEGKC
ncbi:unnamed protein product [Hydatigera taeniaeformis]|uniref:Uncharacterized protein n=1 Tax=Hydatigena taeniaeformis TaxID=6205 RepID=A0A0R3X982_HYDTA|nr:unnamed protein product [Hydatigera taeniaeformis]